DTVVGSADTLRSAKVIAARVRDGAGDLRTDLARAAYFAVPLRKRKGATNVFADRISVGRARTNDVVLRHHSVSKFQAWFACDEHDRFYVTDAKSTNPTYLNGTQVSRGAPSSVVPGDEVRFGDVAALFTTPELLWEALVLTGPPSSRSVPSSRPGRR